MNSVATMSEPESSRKAKPSPADLAAASRLRRLWDDAVAASRKGPKDEWLTQRAVESVLDVNQSAVSQYINGHIPLNYRAVLAFAEVLGIAPSEIRNDLPEQQSNHVREESHGYELEWDEVRGFPQAVGLGSGAEAEEYAEAHKLKFRAESLRRKGLYARNLAVYYGKGDSMQPRIQDGDAILFDTSDQKPRDGQVFVVRVGKELFAKRCEILEETVFFRTDNPEGDHNWRKPKRMDNPRSPIEIIGRVRWIGSWER